MFVGVDFERYYVLFVAYACLLAIVLNAPKGWYMGRRDADGLMRRRHQPVRGRPFWPARPT